jgi:MFS transporter, DHA1 family, inner membrane transport protein
MNAAESTPALGASLNISGANLGIALGAIVGGRMIDLFVLANVSAAAAPIVAVAIAAAAFLMVTESPKTQTCEECGSATE